MAGNGRPYNDRGQTMREALVGRRRERREDAGNQVDRGEGAAARASVAEERGRGTVTERPACRGPKPVRSSGRRVSHPRTYRAPGLRGVP